MKNSYNLKGLNKYLNIQQLLRKDNIFWLCIISIKDIEICLNINENNVYILRDLLYIMRKINRYRTNCVHNKFRHWFNQSISYIWKHIDVKILKKKKKFESSNVYRFFFFFYFYWNCSTMHDCLESMLEIAERG